MNTVLKPKCLIPDEGGNTQCLGHSAQGYLTPCCWIDANPKTRGIAQDIFYQEKLKISNNDNIIDIIQSKEWLDFYTLLEEESARASDWHPNKAPRVCYKMCSTDSSKGDIYGVKS